MLDCILVVCVCVDEVQTASFLLSPIPSCVQRNYPDFALVVVTRLIIHVWLHIQTRFWYTYSAVRSGRSLTQTIPTLPELPPSFLCGDTIGGYGGRSEVRREVHSNRWQWTQTEHTCYTFTTQIRETCRNCTGIWTRIREIWILYNVLFAVGLDSQLIQQSVKITKKSRT